MSFVNDRTFVSSSDMRSKQFYAMKLHTTAGQVAVASGAGDNVIGIVQNAPNTNYGAIIRMSGRSLAVVDGNAAAIAIGDWLGTNAAGKLVKKSTDKDIVLARAEQASSADGDIINVEVVGPFTLSV